MAGLLDLLPQLFFPLCCNFLRVILGLHGTGFFTVIGQVPPQCLQPLLAGVVFFLLERHLLDLQLCHPPADGIQFGRAGIVVCAQHGAGLIH